MTHTPGPWEWGEISGHPLDGLLNVQREILRAPDGRIVLRATYGDSGLEFSEDADARLIAAAPDLLAFVEARARAEHNGLCGANPMMDDGPCACAKGWAERLVAKATGEGITTP